LYIKSKLKLLFCVSIFFYLPTALFSQFLETSKYELDQVLFHGNREVSTPVLQTIVSAKESPGWFSQTLQKYTSFGQSAVYFDSLIIPGDVSALRNYYYSNGFFEAQFFTSYSIDTVNMTAILTYHIVEGVQSTINSFTVTGLDELPQDYAYKINEICTIDTTAKYSGRLIDEKQGSILTFCRDNGYMLCSTIGNPYVQIDTIKNKVDVQISFNLGNRYKIKDIRVEKTGEGKELVDDELVKDVADIQDSSYYSLYELQKAQVRLYRTNLFGSALITGVSSDTSGNYVPINIITDIGLLHELSPEIIVNNEENAFNLGFSLGYTKKNFLGSARKLSLSTSTAAQSITEFLMHPELNDTTVYGYADIRGSIEQPFLFGEPINTKFETYLTVQKKEAEYNATIYGTKVNLTFELPRKVYLTSFGTYFNWEYSRYVYSNSYLIDAYTTLLTRDYNISADTAKILSKEFVESQGSKSIKTTNAILGVDISINKADDFLFPTSGYNLSLLIEDGNSIPFLISKIFNYSYSATGYLKTVFTSMGYFSMFGSKVNVLAAKFKAGYIFAHRGDASLIPLNQRFYSGGSNSLRGWQARDLVPLSVINFDNLNSEDFEAVLFRGVTPGGFFQLESSIEARLRLLDRIGSAVFVDFGNTWNDYIDCQLDDVAVAIGFGLRYYSDFAPIRIDFGFKFYDPSDRTSFFKKSIFSETFQLHLGIGEAF